MNSFSTYPSADVIAEAHNRISPYINRTEVLTSSFFNQQSAASLFFKCENFQKAGAFKSRGAMNAALSLSKEELSAGLATHSSGNHAQALARAAQILGTKAFIIMPRTAPAIKVAAVKSYGGIIHFCEPTLAAREKKLEEIVSETGATFIHPYNDYRIIAGQATACKELLEQVTDEPDYIFCPVGGGGLLSGTALSAAYWSPKTKVIGCEPKGADDAFRSFRSGKFVPSTMPKTVADGLLTSLGDLTFPIILEKVHDILCADEQDIINAMRLVWERMKIIIEPSAAVPLAIALSGQINLKDKSAVIIFSGGNVDLNNLLWA
ncbi:MAG: pyridoxal-phosphate dependent enzyme [Bacteroidetes bacterium]|nr:pyridoxal-phosphate dependent enzyme [Bacteroidota bacterium]MBU1580028.1 pyridoxal-phosphate dependent enzyme [Bacteroidota bacterium]MBU2465430.1 pyridoxal-phosphate dependent enzyme [Bacteroidota bacterium]MBU2559166.1 pyridoxal-phosphate dependent enzyme [Bacteroidota bacterium]